MSLIAERAFNEPVGHGAVCAGRHPRGPRRGGSPDHLLSTSDQLHDRGRGVGRWSGAPYRSTRGDPHADSVPDYSDGAGNTSSSIVSGSWSSTAFFSDWAVAVDPRIEARVSSAASQMASSVTRPDWLRLSHCARVI